MFSKNRFFSRQGLWFALFLLLTSSCTQKTNLLGAQLNLSSGADGAASSSPPGSNPSPNPTANPTPSPTPTSTPTPAPTVAPTPITGSHIIKWNPGHYLASGGVLNPGATIANSSFLPWELDSLNNQNAFIGYRMFITWAALEPTQGNYDFSQINSVLTYLKTQLNVPKHLVLVVLPGSFTNVSPGSSTIPQYILSGSQYGPGGYRVGGKITNSGYGWWGGDGNGNTSAACLYRPTVLARWLALQQALGKAYDSEPYFEAIMFQEDSWVEGAWGTNGAPDYPGGNTTLPMYENILTTTVAAFPHTTVIEENTWCCGTPSLTTQLEQFMVQNRVAPGTADTYGQTWISAHNGEVQNWGLNAYIGLIPSFNLQNVLVFSNGTDYRPVIHSMMDIEGPDLGVVQNMGGTIGSGGYTPQDICNALNQTYGSSHAFWTWLGNSSSLPPSAQWNNLAQSVSNCSLVNTSYPKAYP
jgi:hypothetical protein